jgi:hypothetical protein
MARMTKREADEFRQKIKSILAEPQHWRGFEEQRRWLQKLLQREENYYTQAERKAVDSIAFARTPFKGWAGYSVPELAKGALRYVADFGYDDELFLKEAEHANQLVIGDMRALVGLCILAGMDVPRFNPGPMPSRFDDDM